MKLHCRQCYYIRLCWEFKVKIAVNDKKHLVSNYCLYAVQRWQEDDDKMVYKLFALIHKWEVYSFRKSYSYKLSWKLYCNSGAPPVLAT